MKKIFVLIAVVLSMACEENIKTNNPAFQGKLNDVFWRADTKTAIESQGKLVVKGSTEHEIVTVQTETTAPGTYILGTQNQDNFGTYTFNDGGAITTYSTEATDGPVFRLQITSAGSGYNDASSVLTTGGSGSGLKLVITTTNGVVSEVMVLARGSGYKPGDILTIDGGNSDAKIRVLNTQTSNGEVIIEEFKDGKVTGSFKFNAVDSNGNVTNFSKGVFYQVPVTHQ